MTKNFNCSMHDLEISLTHVHHCREYVLDFIVVDVHLSAGIGCHIGHKEKLEL